MFALVLFLALSEPSSSVTVDAPEFTVVIWADGVVVQSGQLFRARSVEIYARSEDGIWQEVISIKAGYHYRFRLQRNRIS